MTKLSKPSSNTSPASGRSWRTAVVALALAFWVHLYNHLAPLDSYWPPHSVQPAAEDHFSSTYYEARALFRQRAAAIDAQLYRLPLEHLAHLDLSIDVAVVPGAVDRAVVHISGTHGVEGFAGSGIQSALLEQLANVTVDRATAPTLIFVHALNPYGMAMLRRFNEHNVDLNRNFMTPEGFQKRFDQDPNAYGYVDLLDALNPPEPTKPLAWIHAWMQLVRHTIAHGPVSVKLATVAGNYHFPTTIFYGGKALEPSAQLFHQFLRDHLDLDRLRVLGVIDVHTGLGPAGYDTLMLETAGESSKMAGIFRDRTPHASGDDGDAATSGYEGTTGLMCSGFDWLLPKHVETLCLTQEFGTLAGPFVLDAMIKENAMFHHAPSRRLPYAEKLRDAFYVHHSVKWKSDVVSRGLTVWRELVTHVASVDTTTAKKQ